MTIGSLLTKCTQRASFEARAFYYKNFAAYSRSPNLKIFECPLCGWSGPFMTIYPTYGQRLHAVCPKCRAAERHRLQQLVLDNILAQFSPGDKRCLQFAPDQMTDILKRLFGEGSIVADLEPKRGSMMNVDMRSIQFPNNSFDFIFASHVLEHIKEDTVALAECYRILKPGGMAVLPVPIVCSNTIEYPFAVPEEAGHVRAPGMDYFDRYRSVFDSVRIFTSDDFDERYQLYIFEDRTQVPNEHCPYRTKMEGDRHIDAVPVCQKLSN